MQKINKLWKRINETCLSYTDKEGNEWQLTANRGKSSGRHYGHHGYDASVQLFKNGQLVETSFMNYAWSTVKHLRPSFVISFFRTKIEGM